MAASQKGRARRLEQFCQKSVKFVLVQALGGKVDRSPILLPLRAAQWEVRSGGILRQDYGNAPDTGDRCPTALRHGRHPRKRQIYALAAVCIFIAEHIAVIEHAAVRRRDLRAAGENDRAIVRYALAFFGGSSASLKAYGYLGHGLSPGRAAGIFAGRSGKRRGGGRLRFTGRCNGRIALWTVPLLISGAAGQQRKR